MIRAKGETHARLPIYLADSAEEDGTLFHVQTRFLSGMSAGGSRRWVRAWPYSKTVDFFPRLDTDEAELVRRYSDDWAIFFMQCPVVQMLVPRY